MSRHLSGTRIVCRHSGAFATHNHQASGLSRGLRSSTAAFRGPGETAESPSGPGTRSPSGPSGPGTAESPSRLVAQVRDVA